TFYYLFVKIEINRTVLENKRRNYVCNRRFPCRNDIVEIDILHHHAVQIIVRIDVFPSHYDILLAILIVKGQVLASTKSVKPGCKWNIRHSYFGKLVKPVAFPLGKCKPCQLTAYLGCHEQRIALKQILHFEGFCKLRNGLAAGYIIE